MPEVTGPQVLIQADYDGTLQPPTTKPQITYAKLREMRKDPTISLARRLMIAPVLASPWSFEEEEGAPEGAKEFIAEQLQPFRAHLLESGFLGTTDFGWQPYEKVFKTDSKGQVVISKIKPLLQDHTTIKIIPKTGAYDGLEQDPPEGCSIRLKAKQTLLLNIDVEGTDWYGTSTLANCEDAYDSWLKSDAAAERYGSKVAGAHWVVHYPLGYTMYEGVETDNFEIAKKILMSLQSAGAVCLPSTLSAFTDTVDQAAQPEWRIELKSDGGGGASVFTDRQRYLDALKVRALGMPERAILEGQFGTLAEAEAHADFAITNMDMRHRSIAQLVNDHVVNDLLEYNYGPDAKDTVYVEPAPITDLALQYLRSVYTAFLGDDMGRLQEMEGIDFEAFRDRLGLPTKPATDVDLPGFVPQDVYPQSTEAGSEGTEDAGEAN